MDIQATKIELIKQLLDVKKESVLNKIQDILSSETPNSNETLVYTSDGKPLTKNEYIQRIKQISQEIENGAKTYAAEEVQDYVLNKNRK